MAKVRITLTNSPIHRPKRQKDTLKALGIKKMHQTVERESNPQTMGMVKLVQHLVKVEEA